jgi:undecaprenyl-diphosphatase
MLALTVLASDQISLLLKESIQRLRPVHDPVIEHLAHNVLRKGGLYGFVSSHASNAFAILFFTASIFKNKSYWVLLSFWALLFSYSRIYSGVHFPLDVIGGALLGSLLGWAFYKLLMFIENHFFLARNPKIEKTNLQPAQAGTVFLVFAVLAITAVIVTHLLHHYNYL